MDGKSSRLTIGNEHQRIHTITKEADYDSKLYNVTMKRTDERNITTKSRPFKYKKREKKEE